MDMETMNPQQNKILPCEKKISEFKKINYRVKGSSLMYAIMVCLVMTVLCTILISVGLYQRKAIHDILIKKRLMDNSESGIQLLLSANLEEDNYTRDLVLFDNALDSVTINKSSWGLFSILTSTANRAHEQQIGTVMAGWEMSTTELNTCFFTQTKQQPIGITGESKLTGNVYVPEKIIKPLNIAGKTFEGTQTVQGNSYDAGDMDVTYIKKMISTYEKNWNLTMEPAVLMDSIMADFTNPTQYIYADGELRLNRVKLIGNILLESKTKIVVMESCDLNNVILKAPIIEIKEGVKANFQAFATDSIIIGEQVHLTYPSVLCLMPQEESEYVAGLVIHANSRVNGIVAALQKNPMTKPATLLMEKGVTVSGQVLWEGTVISGGRVYGPLMAESIGAQIGSTYYAGAIADMVIEKWNPGYTPVCIPFEMGGKRHQTIIQWLKK
jgi:hypothetical protein